MKYEIFEARKSHKKYYVFDKRPTVLDVEEIARAAKRAYTDYTVIEVWVEGANMYDSKTAGAKKKWAVTRG